ncbi:unnamed protein product [Schistosoma turkestanicum]|nr:unnamed protein product [Schistosoma turkestanicum]
MFNSQWTLSNLSSSLLLSVVLHLSLSLRLVLLLLLLLVISFILVLLIFTHYYYNNSSHYSVISWLNNYLSSATTFISSSPYFTASLSLSSLSSASWMFCILFSCLGLWLWRFVCHVNTQLYHQKVILLFFRNIIGNFIGSIGNYIIYSKIYAILLVLCTDLINFISNLIREWNVSNALKSIIDKSIRFTHRKHSSHGMNTLFTLYLGLLIYVELWGFNYVESRPIPSGVERRYGNLDLHPSKSSSLSSSQQRTPKVVMPPYDLGFKGQKTDELNKAGSSSSSSSFFNDFNSNFDQMKGFQSDETYVRDSQIHQQKHQRLQQEQRYQRVNRDNFNSQKENINHDDGDDNNAKLFNAQLIYDSKLSKSNHINKNNVRSYGQSPSVSSSIPDKEINERLDYRRVNLAPSKQPIQQQIPYSPYNPYAKMNDYQESLYIPDRKTLYDVNTQQQYSPQQETNWVRKNQKMNPYQRHELYDDYRAYMDREDSSSWFPMPSYQSNNHHENNPLNNRLLYSQQSKLPNQRQQSSGINSYLYFDTPNNDISNNYHSNQRNPLSSFPEISDVQLSHLIYQYQMELLRRQTGRLTHNDYQLGHNYYGQPGESSSHYLPNYYHSQDHGLHLSGAKNHDQIIQKFNNLANQRLMAGIEEFFDELDHNRDRVITLNELRNYLLLHEIHFTH